MTSKKSNILIRLASFEDTITKNDEAGVQSKMFLSSTAVAKNPGSRPTLLRGGSKRLVASCRRLRPVSETRSTRTVLKMHSAHSRVISSIGEDWGTLEKPNDEDDSFGSDGFGDFGGADDDDWQSVTSNTQSVVSNSLNESMSSFQPKNDKPRTSTPGGRRPDAPRRSSAAGGSSSQPKGTPSSSSTSKTYMSSMSKTYMPTSGGGASAASPPARRKSSGGSSSRPSGSSHSSQVLLGGSTHSRVGGSTHSRSGSSRPKESGETSKGRRFGSQAHPCGNERPHYVP
jgi:hypothetical protein